MKSIGRRRRATGTSPPRRRERSPTPRERAGVLHWHPIQLRHTAEAKFRLEHGRDVAKAILGHRLVETTQVYADIDAAKAAGIMARVG